MDIGLNDRKLLKKHADLILCSNPMSLIQRKIFNVLLYKALPSMNDAIWFEMPIKDICVSIGYTSRNYIPLVNAIETITQLGIRWRIIDSKTKLEDIISDTMVVITRIKIENGVCYYKYNDDIKLKLLRPGMYGKIDLKIQSTINSSFGLVLYELSEKFKNIGFTPWFTIEQLRELMGVKKNGYRSFYDLEKNVIIKAVNEVNEKTKFQVEASKKKTGKLVEQIRFIISQKEVEKGYLLESNNISDHANNKIIDILIKDFKVDFKEAIKLYEEYSNIDKYGENYIADKINFAKKSSGYITGKLNNPAGFIIDAIKKDYKYSLSNSEIVNEQYRNKVSEEAKKRKEKEQIYDQDKAYSEYLNVKVLEYLQSMSEEEVDYLKCEFVEYCSNNNKIGILKYYDNGNGLDRPMVRSIFNSYVTNNQLKGRVMTREQFIKNG